MVGVRPVLAASFLLLVAAALPVQAQLQVETAVENPYLRVVANTANHRVGTWHALTTDQHPDAEDREQALLASGPSGGLSTISLMNWGAGRVFAADPQSVGTVPLDPLVAGSEVDEGELEVEWEVLPPTGEHIHLHERFLVLSTMEVPTPDTSYILHSVAACNESTQLQLGIRVLYDFQIGSSTALRRAWISSDQTTTPVGVSAGQPPAGSVGALFERAGGPFETALLWAPTPTLNAPYTPTPPTLAVYDEAPESRQDWGEPDGAGLVGDGAMTLVWGHTAATAFQLTVGQCAEVHTILSLGLAALFPPADANLPPEAYPSARPGTTCLDPSVRFTGSASYDLDGSITEYRWSFGDGNEAEGETAQHTYDRAGPMTATLRVRDNLGTWDTSSVTFDQLGPLNCPPELGPVRDIYVMAGQSLEETFTASDAEQDDLQFTLTPAPHEVRAAFRDQGGQAVLEWTPMTVGRYDFLLEVRDGHGSDSATFSIHVLGPAAASGGAHDGGGAHHGETACPSGHDCIGDPAQAQPRQEAAADPAPPATPTDCAPTDLDGDGVVDTCMERAIPLPRLEAPARDAICWADCDDGRPLRIGASGCDGCDEQPSGASSPLPAAVPVLGGLGAAALLLAPLAAWATRRWGVLPPK